MNVLVTGATGQVGSRLVPRLIDAGESVRVLVRDAARPTAVTLAARGAELVVGDLTDADALRRAVDGQHAVVHSAAIFRSLPDEQTAFAVNTHATVALAEAAFTVGASRFVFLSTSLVYGNGHRGPQTEDAEPLPSAFGGHYPASKLAAERALRQLHADAGLDLRVLRLAFVYGDGDPHLESAMSRPAHPAARLRLVHHADLAQAVLRALRADGLAGRTYNIGDDAGLSYAEIFAFHRATIADDAFAAPVGDLFFGVADTSRARAELGFRPLFPTAYTARDVGAL
jgi:nucleoside-diphosphate-sugar epimerase